VTGDDLVEHPADELREALVGTAVEGVLHETTNDQPVGRLGLDAARVEVEALLVVDVPRGDAMAAADVVGLDLSGSTPAAE
jgi:hypothetical protein